jgi:hypothetical protein
MSIVLRSASGKWKYKTSSNDPIFAPILESLLEATGTLEPTITIPGALGEALDVGWMYVERIKQWMVWNRQYVLDVLPSNYMTQSVYHTAQDLQDVRGYKSAPPPVVYMTQVEVLSRALSLPIGWQSYVIIEESYSLAERLNHMKASLAYLRENNDISAGILAYIDFRAKTHQVYSDAADPTYQVNDGVTYRMANKAFHGSLLTPFLRQIWMQDIDGKLVVDALLARVDWRVAIPLLEEYQGQIYTIPRVIEAGRAVLGESIDTANLEVVVFSSLKRTDKGIVELIRVEDTVYVGELYSKILSNLPTDVDPADIGLESVLGRKASPSLAPVYPYGNNDRYSAVPPNHIVPWINTCTLTYIGWIRSDKKSTPKALDAKLINDSNLSDVVELIGETLGIYAMRRILLSLLYFVEKHANKKGKVQVEEVRRANAFATLIEAYLEEHEEDDEGLVTLFLGESNVVKRLTK